MAGIPSAASGWERARKTLQASTSYAAAAAAVRIIAFHEISPTATVILAEAIAAAVPFGLPCFLTATCPSCARL
ncbi:hypothetical protein MUK42_16858 [Musa troglodytarum]|uniref:Uncharacterized protein n=1 Tax=Musa troglodytarum TaxID=320322 RepID=A0A9E7KSP0_9LILI|nr:hypothetical protein MUK42_16858 [Musa troglodytarum]